VEEERIASTSMSVQSVSKGDIPVISAHERALWEVLDLRATWLCWVQNLMWSDLDLGISHVAL